MHMSQIGARVKMPNFQMRVRRQAIRIPDPWHVDLNVVAL